jgi:hypothetical protein
MKRDRRDRSELAYIVIFGAPFAIIAFGLSIAWHALALHEDLGRNFFVSQAVIWSVIGIISGALTRRRLKKKMNGSAAGPNSV